MSYLLGVYVPDMNVLKHARKDYQNGNYQEAYLGFAAQSELSASDELMMKRSAIVSRLEHKIEAYENYKSVGMDLEAVNSLIQGAGLYYSLQEEAAACKVDGEAYQCYLEIDQLLQTNYGINGETANWIYSNPDDVIYTINVKHVLAGETDQLIETIEVEYVPVDDGEVQEENETVTIQ